MRSYGPHCARGSAGGRVGIFGSEASFGSGAGVFGSEDGFGSDAGGFDGLGVPASVR